MHFGALCTLTLTYIYRVLYSVILLYLLHLVILIYVSLSLIQIYCSFSFCGQERLLLTASAFKAGLRSTPTKRKKIYCTKVINHEGNEKYVSILKGRN